MKYIAYNDQGKTTGAYIQDPAHDLYIEATDEQMAQWFNYKVVGGALVLDPPAPVQVIPTEVTMRQARLALLDAGLLSAVNAAVAAADEQTQISWEFSSMVERDNPLVATLTAALGLSESQLNALFLAASQK